MRFTETLKREIVDTGAASTAGRVRGFVVDPGTQRVTGLHVGKGDGKYLAWSDVSSFGVDAVTVDAADRIRSATADDRADQPSLLGHRVLDEHGVEHGTVTDVEFDPNDGRLRYLLTSTREIDGTLLRGIGTWAAIVAIPSPSTTPPPAPETT